MAEFKCYLTPPPKQRHSRWSDSEYDLNEESDTTSMLSSQSMLTVFPEDPVKEKEGPQHAGLCRSRSHEGRAVRQDDGDGEVGARSSTLENGSPLPSVRNKVLNRIKKDEMPLKERVYGSGSTDRLDKKPAKPNGIEV